MLCNAAKNILKAKNVCFPEALDEIKLLQEHGLWLKKEDSQFCLDLMRDLEDVTFCFVDIESTDSKPLIGKLLEIGAVKYKINLRSNGSKKSYIGEVASSFETLCFCDFVPKLVENLTGITPKMLQNAPSERDALLSFRDFLKDSVFVAHNVNFDYGFLSTKLESMGEMPLLNPRLCTQTCSKAQILSKKYSLAFLNDFLGINFLNLHRAYVDAKCALKVFEIASFPILLGIERQISFKEFVTKIQKKEYHGY